MAKSSKLVAVRKGLVLLVRRRVDGRWMFPGGRKRGNEDERECIKRELKEELPKVKLGRLQLWKEVTVPTAGSQNQRRHLYRQESFGSSFDRRQKRDQPSRLAETARLEADPYIALHQGQAIPQGLIPYLPGVYRGPPGSRWRALYISRRTGWTISPHFCASTSSADRT